MDLKKTYHAFYPINWKERRSYEILFIKSPAIKKEHTLLLNEVFMKKRISFDTFEIQLENDVEFFERMKFSELETGNNANDYYLSTTASPEKWIRFRDYHNIQGLIKTHLQKQLQKPRNFFQKFLRLSA